MSGNQYQSLKGEDNDEKILIIDDDPNILDYLSALFTDNGYDTQVALDAAKGLETARRFLPDLITLDIEMPGEWGRGFIVR